MLITWVLALLASLGLRHWGLNHPDPFEIRPLIVWLLLLAPSIFVGFLLFFIDLRKGST